jgi:hypothetical protein
VKKHTLFIDALGKQHGFIFGYYTDGMHRFARGRRF